MTQQGQVANCKARAVRAADVGLCAGEFCLLRADIAHTVYCVARSQPGWPVSIPPVRLRNRTPPINFTSMNINNIRGHFAVCRPRTCLSIHRYSDIVIRLYVHSFVCNTSELCQFLFSNVTSDHLKVSLKDFFRHRKASAWFLAVVSFATNHFVSNKPRGGGVTARHETR
jgi:hypothetical protein